MKISLKHLKISWNGHHLKISLSDLEISLIGLKISLIGLKISLIHLKISLINLEISLIDLEISLIYLEISLIHLEISLIIINWYMLMAVIGWNMVTWQKIIQCIYLRKEYWPQKRILTSREVDTTLSSVYTRVYTSYTRTLRHRTCKIRF